jgi:RNA polymerase sigma-70 factor (ECF subfamily)
MTQINDIDRIVAGCKKGDEESFSALFDAYSEKLYAFFYRLCGNRAVSQDLLSELFVKLVKKIDAYNTGSFNCWIYTVASNIFRDYLRKRKRSKEAMDKFAENQQIDYSEEKNSDADTVLVLEKAMTRLDEDERHLITLRFFSSLSFKEMAEIRSEPIGTTLSKLHRSLKKLREYMEAEHETSR